MPEHHTVADATLNMFLLAHNLFADELVKLHSQKQLAGFTAFFNFQNILHAGMEMLADKISMFNQHHVQQTDVTVVYSFATTDSAESFTDIEKYVVNAENNLDLNSIELDLSLNMNLN